jgi:glutamate racemase
MIGIFDSGLGGLFFLEKAKIVYPKEKFTLFQDSKFMPYGNKTKEQIYERSVFSINYLKKNGAKKIICACNTASLVLNYFNFKEPDFISLFQFLEKTCDLYKKNGVVLNVLCTKLSAEILKSNSFFDFHNIVSLPELAQLIEKKEDTFNYLAENLKNIKGPLLLACTHFSAVQDELSQLGFFSIDLVDLIIKDLAF